MTAWYSADEADDEAQERLVGAWPDAPTANLETLGMLVEVARDQVWAYAPESDDDDGNAVVVPEDAPKRLVYAQLKQVENLWNAGRVSSDGNTGMDGFVFTPRPLDKTIKRVIRPERVPNVC